MAALRLILVALLATTAAAYTNHTVGGNAGWLFNPANNKTSADYAAWTANRTFNLGDFLLFNTTTNQTVIQTYNRTTFTSCTTDDSLDNDTFEYNGGDPQFEIRTIIPVPLIIKGPQYYFSDAQDGKQCRHGMAFEIKVNQGAGLPPSLNQPPPPPYASPPTTANNEDDPPTETIPTLGPNGSSRIKSNFLWLSMVILVLAPIVV